MRGIENAGAPAGGASSENSREVRLDHSVGEGARMKHDDELEIDEKARRRR